MVNSSKKGAASERVALNLLSKLCNDFKFRRSGRGFKGNDTANDPEGFPFAIEVKDVKAIKLIHLFKGNKELGTYLQQTIDQANATGRQPLLLIKIESVWFLIAYPGAIRDYLRFDHARTQAIYFCYKSAEFFVYMIDELIQQKAYFDWDTEEQVLLE